MEEATRVVINWICRNMSDPILKANRPEWHTTLRVIETQLWTALDGLKSTLGDNEQDPLLRAYTAETVVALNNLLPLLTNIKNSWSNNFKAKISQKRKAETAAEVAARLADGVLVLHGLWAKDAYVYV